MQINVQPLVDSRMTIPLQGAEILAHRMKAVRARRHLHGAAAISTSGLDALALKPHADLIIVMIRPLSPDGCATECPAHDNALGEFVVSERAFAFRVVLQEQDQIGKHVLHVAGSVIENVGRPIRWRRRFRSELCLTRLY